MCVSVKIYTRGGFSPPPSLTTLTFKSKSDKRREGNRLYISFTHTHAHINQKASEPVCAQIAPRSMPSFILCTRIIKHENSQTRCPLTPPHTHTKHTQRCGSDVKHCIRWCQRRADWPLLSTGVRWSGWSCVFALRVTTQQILIHAHVHTDALSLPLSLLAFADQAPVKHAAVAIWSLCESCC